MSLWKKAVLCCAGALMGCSVLSVPISIFAEDSETLTYTVSGNSKTSTEKLPVLYNSWDITYTYSVEESQHWDDASGSVVYESEVMIHNIHVNETCAGLMMPMDEYDPEVYDCSYPVEQVTIEVPDNFNGIPVTSIEEITWEVGGSGVCTGTGFLFRVPATIYMNYATDEEFSPFSTGFFNGYLSNDPTIALERFYNGTCEELFAAGYPGGAAECTDGSILADGGDYDSVYRIVYDGTCEEWLSICPDELSTVLTVCADGTLNEPIPEETAPADLSYSYDIENKIAVYVGNEPEDITTLSIPSRIYGYSVEKIGDNAINGYAQLTTVEIAEGVTSIGDEAFLSCENLVSVSIPESVESIGDYAIGFWKNSDGTYSKMSKTVIYCAENSAAHAYAQAYGLSYRFFGEELQAEPYDVNCDGKITVLDVVMLQKWLLGQTELTMRGATAADVVYDGCINAFDLACLKQMLLWLISVT